ncbi:hypothetical protein MRB53_026191 [Persea americana]|uniref:Uncharacterized protein n=1 Tax=Persea americana TaxID=3435 RepID=A0ACC2LHW5_PERAE|nr:hypothetical protein MRB53_026191 [Persea americana]
MRKRAAPSQLTTNSASPTRLTPSPISQAILTMALFDLSIPQTSDPAILAQLDQASIASSAPPLTSSSTFSPNQTSLKPPNTLTLVTPPIFPSQPTLSPKSTDHSPRLLSNKVIPPKLKRSKPKEASLSINDLPYDVISETLKKTPTPTIDTSNPFSILENCSFVNPSFYGHNLQTNFEGNSSTEPPPGFEHPQGTSYIMAPPEVDQPSASLTIPKQTPKDKQPGNSATADPHHIHQVSSNSQQAKE